MSDPLRVLIADDHPLVRSGLRGTLLSLGGFDIVGEATTGEEAVRAAAESHPDVVVLDINMPGLDGIEAARRIVDAESAGGVLMLTMFEEDDSIFAAMRAGARGYVVKGAGEEDVVRAIRAVAQGDAIFSPGVAERVLRYLSSGPSIGHPTPFPQLTHREQEVLELIAEGQSNTVIARRLFLSPKTVRNHVSNIFMKLHVAARSEAIVRARQAGMGRDADRGGEPPRL